jgi:hypothetical protein
VQMVCKFESAEFRGGGVPRKRTRRHTGSIVRGVEE